MKNIISLFIVAFVLVYTISAQNVEDDLWTKSSSSSLKTTSLKKMMREVEPQKFELYNLNLSLLKEKLKGAPSRGDSYGTSNVIISFPNNKGVLEKFQIMEASVMEPELQKKFPDIRSYIGKGIDNPSSIIRFSVTPLGLNSMLLSNKESDVLIDPYTSDKLIYKVYSTKDILDSVTSMENDVIDLGLNKSPKILRSAKTIGDSPNDGKLRTFRLALATNGEYSQWILSAHGIPDNATDEVKKSTVLSALNTIMTRVNAIFERDICLTMKLVTNETSIIFLDPETDGYGSDYIAENQKKCDLLIGNENYDIGHLIVFQSGTSGGGLAAVRCACQYAGKAMAYSIMVDRLDIILHEMGHQFGAGHSTNSCHGFGVTQESVEPGCGRSIMAALDDEANYFFHSVSIQVIWNNISSGYSQCATLTETGNIAPIADAGNDLTIPKSTPFVLEGQGTDTNGGLTYSWEQIDSELTVYPPVSNANGGPVFIWEPPTLSPNRYMPDIVTIISGSLNSETEAVPSVSRVLNFNFVVRDNDIKGGQIAIDTKIVTVDGNSGPFVVTSHKTPETWYSGSTKTITWDVAGTNSGAVNTQTVDILFSTDGGYTYPTKLASAVPNNGVQEIVIPFGIKTTTGRYMIRAVGNIFFAINSANLIVDESPFLTNFGNKSIDLCLPESSVTYEFTYNSYLGHTGTTTFSANGPIGTSSTFNPTSASTNGTLVKMIVTGITTANLGKNTITITGTSSGNTMILSHENVLLNVFNSSMPTITLLSPSNGSVNVSPPYALTWNAEPNAKTCTLEIATDESFANIIETATLSTNSYKPSSIKINTNYYWRVKCNNPCGNGIYSGINSFKTLNLSMFTYIPDNNFQLALRNLGYDSDNIDNYIRTSNIKNITTLDISNRNISDLTGIQDFYGLTVLRCSGNHLKNLDLSKNTSLWMLYCSNNELTNIDLTNNTNLFDLNCPNNKLMSLDLTNNTSLYTINCSDNELTFLDVTNCLSLQGLRCQNNKLTDLDLSRNIILHSLYFYNNKISSVDISKSIALYIFDCSNNLLTALDVTKNITLIELNCGWNQLSILDVTKNIALIKLDCSYNQLTDLDVINNIELTTFSCSVNKIRYLDVSKNIALIDLICVGNQLSTLDVTNNIKLVYLRCFSNQLSNLDLSKNLNLSMLDVSYNVLTSINITKNTLLRSLLCGTNKLTSLDLTSNFNLDVISCLNNNITSLDLTNNTKFFYLCCLNNKLKRLNIKNGSNTGLASMYAQNNPDLACIQVDNAILSSGYQDWQKDATASYSEDCASLFPAPTITSFNPSSASKGETINIIGTNFTEASKVSFGGLPAAITTIVSPTNITAIVGEGKSGNVSISTSGGMASLSGFVFISNPQINQQDSIALVALYNTTDGSNWTKKANWLIDRVNNWEGVTVEGKRVVALNLSSVGLVGSLPTELSNLTELRELILSNNKLSGSLPQNWSSLVNLQSLRLDNNKLSDSLPASWSALIKLTYLDLHNNQFIGILPSSLSSLVNLTDLDISNNKYTGILPDSWSALINLQSLNLSGNQFTGDIPDGWSSLVNLYSLDLYDNRLAGLPDLSSLTNLDYLMVYNNLLDFGDIEPNIGVPQFGFGYSQQAPVGKTDTIVKTKGQEFRISITVGGKSNKYQWYKNRGIISGAIGTEYVIPYVTASDAGIYTCQITNTVANQLTLQSQPITLQIQNLVDEKVVQSSDLKVYSISSKGIYKIDGLPTNTKNEIAVYTLDGKLIKKINSVFKIETIDISDQASGSYLLIINKQLFKIEKSN